MNLTLPREIQFRAGAVKYLGKKAAGLGMTKPLVVSDPAMSQLGFSQKVSGVLEEAGLASVLFDGCRENPAEPEVAQAAGIYADQGCDGFIALGGGSAMDVAKGARIVAKHGGSILDYDVTTGGMKKIAPGLPPLIALPTTAGSGSEATLGTVIIDPAKSVKILIYSPHLVADSVVLDPELTVSLPPAVTAATGLDALVHALEAYTAPGYNPLADGMCRTSIELIGKSLARAVAQGDDLAARGDMMMAALTAGIAFASKGLGAVHALSHQLSSYFHLPHGLANALMLPHVMRFNAEAVGDKYIEAAGILGYRVDTAEQAAEALAGLVAKLGLPTKLGEVGVSLDKLEQMAGDAYRDAALGGNPVKCDQAQLQELYRQAL